MNNHTRHILLAILALAATFGASAKSKTLPSAAEQDSRKADYIYLEAKRHGLQQRFDSYYELMDYARQLNPDDPTMGMDLGIYYLQLDSAGSTRGIDLMKRYVEQNPDDLYNGFSYASLAQRLGYDDLAAEAWKNLHIHFPEREPVTLKYAEMLRRTGNRDSMLMAVAVYDSLAVAGSDPAEVAGLKTTVYYQLGDTAAIVDEARKLLQRSPQDPRYNLYVGNIYNTLLNSDSAIVYFDRAVQLDPSNGLAYYARASYYNQKNDSVAYDREVFDALRQPDLDLDVKLVLLRDYVAKLYTDSLQQPRINELFATLNDQNPHQVEISNLYCDYLMAVHDWAGAAEQASNSLDLEPSDHERWATLASLYLQTKDYDRTTDAASRGLHYFPEDATLYQLKAVGLSAAKRYDEACKTYIEAINMIMETDSTQVSELSDLYTGLGDTYYQAGDNDKAFETYEEALRYNPNNLLALNNAAYYLACEDRNLGRALMMIGQVIAAQPDQSTSLDTYAWVLFKLKQYDKAREAIDKAIANDEEPSTELYEHAGDIYFMDGDPDKAVDFWREALKLSPDNELLKRKVNHKTYFYK